MHTREKYWASKVPLPLALLFLVNVFLVIGLELLFVYKYPANPESADLAKYSAVYEGCDVVNRDTHHDLTASLVKTAEGQTHLVVTKAHSIALGRGKIIYDQPVEMNGSTNAMVYVKNGIRTSEISLTEVPNNLLSVSILFNSSANIREISTWYMLLAAVLEALELMVIHFVRKNLM